MRRWLLRVLPLVALGVIVLSVGGASVLCASYDAAGRMTGVQWVTVTANSGSVATTDDAATVKFFTVDADFVPRANAVPVSLS